ncbi:hypothetical protein AMTR_s00070p00146550 [Amborella trichopoda]|uniref:Uncharacterized protein n=1 Tax=Amborella trichopoda TaxID=13333 RepID=U5DDL5_AMBTC|nr:hypothetical protein AMTR_s00070p00146550 [Amborella trichopoda]
MSRGHTTVVVLVSSRKPLMLVSQGRLTIGRWLKYLKPRRIDVAKTFNSWGVSKMARAGELSITRKTNHRSMVEVLGTLSVDVIRMYINRGVSEMM